MAKITNEPKINDEHINDIRAAIEHRATWMALLLDEAEKSGVEWEEFARKAIGRCGCFHGKGFVEKMKDVNDLKEFAKIFANENGKKIFEMEVAESTEDKLSLRFHYCPLVNAWVKQGFSNEKIEKFCDVAMDGDKGIASNFPEFKFTLGKTIAQGNPVCEIDFVKNK